MESGAGAMMMLSSLLLEPATLVAVTVNLKVPGAEGVPKISPVLLFRFRPSGKLPSVTLQVGAVPSAASFWL